MRTLFLGTCAFACLLLGGAAAGEPARQRMPLDATEQALAREGTRLAFERHLGKALDDGRREILRIERRRPREKERGAERGANVYVYDYDAELTRRVGVRLPSGEVDGFEALPGVQLPLSKREIRRALDIAYADPSVKKRIQDLYRARTGALLVDPSELQSAALVFHARSNPIGLNAAAARCGEHRCAHLLLFTRDHVAVEVIPIVDLSLGSVVQVLDF